MKKNLLPLDRLQRLRIEPASKKAGAAARILPVDDGCRPLLDLDEGFALPTLPGDFRGTAGERFDAHDGGRRVIVVGCGARGAAAQHGQYWESAAWRVAQLMRSANLALAELAGAVPADALPAFATGVLLAGYDNQLYRREPAKDALPAAVLRIPGASRKALQTAIDTAEAVNWARALVDAPANHLTPAAFANEARSLAALGVKVDVLDEATLRKIGAHGLLAVGSSSRNKPCMVVARWNGRAAGKTDLAIVGKGLTFDGGGLNLKLQLIEKMKFDMGGAAAAIAALRLLAAQKAKLNVAVVLAVCENVIAGDAYRPGDVIGSLEGLTIEVANTDAEGRIVVADGISYAKRFKPELLVDIATLTGSISMILHQEFAGLYTNDDALAERIAAAAEQTGDRVWRMPLSPLQDYIVDSDIADVRNLGASNGLGLPSGTSSVAGAKFLERFAGGQRWAHLDMASTVLSSRQRGALRPGPTGWGVRLLAALAAGLAG